MASSLLTNLVSYYKLDGNSNDATATANNGTDTTITYSAGNGKIIQGAGYNGTTSQIVASAVNISDFTMSCWVKTTQASNNIIIAGYLAATAGLWFQLNQGGVTGRITFLVKDSNSNLNALVSTASTYNDGNWHFLVGTKTGNTISYYIDGVLQASDSGVTFTGNFNSCVPSLGVAGYSGAIDEIGYWSRALISQEVQQLYNFGNGNQYSFPQPFNIF